MTQYGWICPKCQSVMNPAAPQCWNCKPENKEVYRNIDANVPYRETLSFCPHGKPVKFNSCTECNPITRV